MKICERAVNFVQTMGYEGEVRLCSWLKDNVIGKLSEQSFYDIYHSKKAQSIHTKLGGGGLF
ncbi:MAG: SPASM domain-containing protein [Synergistaceae bacterium]|nr:SPASM domain-containing protein [Synergistaceae bacterium]